MRWLFGHRGSRRESAVPQLFSLGGSRMRQAILLSLYFTAPIASLLLVVRLVCATFSAKVREEIQRYSVIHFVWGFYSLVGMIILFKLLKP